MTINQRTTSLFKEHELHYYRVERWNHAAKIRQDMWGADYICFWPYDSVVLLVQSTTIPNMAARMTKLSGIREARDWLTSPHREFVVLGWQKRKSVWVHKVWQLKLDFVTGDLDKRITSLRNLRIPNETNKQSGAARPDSPGSPV